MKLKFFFSNEVIIEIVVNPEQKRKLFVRRVVKISYTYMAPIECRACGIYVTAELLLFSWCYDSSTFCVI